MRYLFILLIKIYQKTISPDHGIFKKLGWITKPVCVFYPTCSEYAAEALKKYGTLKATPMILKRISRCHPWQKEHFDPVE